MIHPVDNLIIGQSLVTVDEDEKVRDALTRMLSNDFSQLPVIDKEGKLIGLISDQSISRNYYHHGNQVIILDLKVSDCLEKVVSLVNESDVLDALELLQKSSSVVIVSNERPVGIVTNADAVLFFLDVAEGLVYIEDMEVTLRQDIEEAFPTEEKREEAINNAFKHLKKSNDSLEISYDRLTLGDYLNLIINKQNWSNFESKLKPKELFRSHMEKVRDIRNQIMHFRGRLDVEQRDALKRAHEWLGNRNRHYIGKSPAKIMQTLDFNKEAVSSKEKGSLPIPKPVQPPTEGKYGPLQDYLSDLASESAKDSATILTFKQIEEILENSLPNSAREHRSWWSNDSTSPLRHSQAWLKGGWEVADVNFTNEEVTFLRTDRALYRIFWADLIDRVRTERPSLNLHTKTYGNTYLFFNAGKPGIYYGWFLPTNQEEIWTRLFIDTRGTDSNLAAKYFKLLVNNKSEIEDKFGEPLKWDNTTNKKAVQIYASHPFRISIPYDGLKETQEWALRTMLQLVDTMQSRIAELE